MKNNYFFCIFISFFTYGEVSLPPKEDLENVENNGTNKNHTLQEKDTTQETTLLRVLRKNNFLYKKMHQKYIINTKKNNLKACDIQYFFQIVREINFKEKYNATIIEDLGFFIKILFKGIENNEIDAFDDNTLSKKISIFDIKNKMLMPHNPELGMNKKDLFFEFEDVCLVEIISNYVKSVNYPNPIFDDLVLKIKIPAEYFAEGIERTICCFKYSDAIDFLIKKEYKIHVNDTEMLFTDVLKRNMFNYMYLFIDGIDINEKYKIKENDFYKNNQIGLQLIKNYK